MRIFSERKGIKPVKSSIQTDFVDEVTRNRLWDAVTVHYWQRMTHSWISEQPEIMTLITRIWHLFFKKPIDTIDDYWKNTLKELREYFFHCKWNEVYDFVEFIANNYPDDSVNREFTEFCNSVLEQELSAYRFVGGRITEITAKEEIAEIEEALETPMKTVNEHLKTALGLLVDRKSPDYRNSIKESISAVESICKLITRNPNLTLDDALDVIERENKVKIHPALKRAFGSLYGYTSAAEGIRHGLSDEPSLYFEDAKFMLVSCSGFVNYLVAKSSKAGIALGK